MKRGNLITLANCVNTWSNIPQDELEDRLDAYYGCDILTSQTLRDIKDNNDKLREE